MSVEDIVVEVPPGENGQAWEFSITVDLPPLEEVMLWLALSDEDADLAFARRVTDWDVLDENRQIAPCVPGTVYALMHHKRIGPPMIAAVLERALDVDLGDVLANSNEPWTAVILRELEAAIREHTH